MQNWRAVAALVVSAGPTMPGLINMINSNISVGNASYLFNISWMYGVRRFPFLLITWAKFHGN